MKRHVISVLLSLTTVLSFSQVPTQGGRTDSIDVGMFMIVEGVDSPYVEIYLSPQKSYVVESHFCEEDEKVELEYSSSSQKSDYNNIEIDGGTIGEASVIAKKRK